MQNETAFDPDAPLPGAPDPWASTGTPSHRSAPPYHMTDMIAAEPALARRLLARLAGESGSAADLATAIGATLGAGAPVVVTGCGTSEHAAQATAVILAEAASAAGLAGAHRSVPSRHSSCHCDRPSGVSSSGSRTRVGRRPPMRRWLQRDRPVGRRP